MFLKSTSGMLAPVAPMFFKPSGTITEEQGKNAKWFRNLQEGTVAVFVFQK
jgi:hypothetical protein